MPEAVVDSITCPVFSYVTSFPESPREFLNLSSGSNYLAPIPP